MFIIWHDDPTDGIERALERVGARVTPLEGMPALVAQAPTEALPEIRRLSHVLGVRRVEDGPMRNRSTQGDPRPEFPRAAWSTYLNEKLCNHGDGIDIGFIEAFGDSSHGARVLEQHTAFDWPVSGQSNISYWNANVLTCSTHADCEALCGAFGTSDECQCVDGECVSLHQTGVLARVGSYHHCPDPGVFAPDMAGQIVKAGWEGTFLIDVDDCEPGFMGAAKADFYVANNRLHDSASLPDQIKATNTAYQWLLASPQSVDVINESWGPVRGMVSGLPDPMSWRALLSDYYARLHQVTIVHAAGQVPGGGEGVECDGFNTLCIGGTDYVGPSELGYDYSADDYELDATSNALNPSIRISVGTFRQLGLSKPDAVASSVAGDVPAPDKSSPEASSESETYLRLRYQNPDTNVVIETDVWRDIGEGTSFAAPLATGVIAQLFRALGTTLPNAEVRAMTYAGAVYQPWHSHLNQSVCSGSTPPFPTSNGCDFEAGVGSFTASLFYHFGILFTDFCGGSGDPPCPYPPEICEGTGTHASGFIDDSPELTSLPGSRLGFPTGPAKIGGSDGFSIRAALSYYSCPASTANAWEASGTPTVTENDLGVAVDLDLGLYARNGGGAWTLLAETTNVEETNEGFWYATDTKWDEVQTFVLVPSPWTPCAGTFNGEGLGDGEPYGYADVFWTKKVALP